MKLIGFHFFSYKCSYHISSFPTARFNCALQFQSQGTRKDTFHQKLQILEADPRRSPEGGRGFPPPHPSDLRVFFFFKLYVRHQNICNKRITCYYSIYMPYWPSMRSRWLDIGWVHQPILPPQAANQNTRFASYNPKALQCYNKRCYKLTCLEIFLSLLRL